MNDGPSTIVVTILVLILWLFSIYRLYRVWAVKLNFSGVSLGVRYIALHIATCEVQDNTRGWDFLYNWMHEKIFRPPSQSPVKLKNSESSIFNAEC